ncbi:phytoene/squalene synthase family protein [Rhodobacteraceae bacterium XHP0102]|nr:phytoene/squalene synthase family protein [Rhodobacteraceae bacterium XHP0102]
MITAEDLAYCRAAIAEGSHSFDVASRILPRSVRDPALALYAFCRISDDAVDLSCNKAHAVLDLSARLDRIYSGAPVDYPADRAFAAVVRDFEMPRALPEALLEGLAWDATERRYHSLSDLRSYSARVASAVGAMMCVLMGVRSGDALARACDLGVAMQLTNIARDVGEDARAGRIYLPLDWLAEEGVDPDRLLADPRISPALRRINRRLLAEARRLYVRSEAGVSQLPFISRAGILAARHCYDAIGGAVARRGYDGITQRAYTTRGQKLGLLSYAALQAMIITLAPRCPILFAPPLEETRFLVEAAAQRQADKKGWSDQVISVLAQLEAQDRSHALEAKL